MLRDGYVYILEFFFIKESQVREKGRKIQSVEVKKNTEAIHTKLQNHCGFKMKEHRS
jgi:hypothetical protein